MYRITALGPGVTPAVMVEAPDPGAWDANDPASASAMDFANEYFGLLGRGFVSIRIQAPDDKRELRLRGNGKWLDGYFDHEIEHYLDDVTPGYTIVNDGTTDELYDDVVKVLERERKRR